MKYLVVLGSGLAVLGFLNPSIALRAIVITAAVAAVIVLLAAFGVAGVRRIPLLRWLSYKLLVVDDPFGVLAATGDEFERRLSDLNDHFDKRERVPVPVAASMAGRR